MQTLGLKQLPKPGDAEEDLKAELQVIFKMMKVHGVRPAALAEVFGRGTTLGELSDLEAHISPGD